MSKKNKANSEVPVWKKYKSVRLTKAAKELIVNAGQDHSGINKRIEAKLLELETVVNQVYLDKKGGLAKIKADLAFHKELVAIQHRAIDLGYGDAVNANNAVMSSIWISSKHIPSFYQIIKAARSYDSSVKNRGGDWESSRGVCFGMLGDVIGIPGRTEFPAANAYVTGVDASDEQQKTLALLVQELDELVTERDDIRRDFRAILDNVVTTKRLLQQMPEALKLIPDYIMAGMNPPQLPALLIADTAKKLNL